jgi:cellulose synthase/poly-beta-1,6-N-acetylglucosamine synthase-like glycosyltransferase
VTASKIVVMIPALNEERSIGKVIDDIPRKELMSRGYEVRVVVVDGQSTDRTLAIAREKGPTFWSRRAEERGWASARRSRCAIPGGRAQGPRPHWGPVREVLGPRVMLDASIWL